MLQDRNAADETIIVEEYEMYEDVEELASAITFSGNKCTWKYNSLGDTC